MFGAQQQQALPASFQTNSSDGGGCHSDLPLPMSPQQYTSNGNEDEGGGGDYSEREVSAGLGDDRPDEPQHLELPATTTKQTADGGRDSSSSITAEDESASDSLTPDRDTDAVDSSAVLVPPSKEAISIFGEHDVLSGRGGGTNVHAGNRDFRDMINKYRIVYLKARKNDKPGISRNIVKEIRSKGGRFLKKDERSGHFYEIGDAQAREKTSQALRQRAPEMRKLMISVHLQQQQLQHEQQQQLQQQQQQQPGNAVAAADPAFPGPPTHTPAGMTEDQYRWAVESMNQQTAHTIQAMGAVHGGSLNPMMGTSLVNAGPMMGPTTYNPAFFHAMMAGMGGFPPSGGGVMPYYPQNAAPEGAMAEGVSADIGLDFGGMNAGSTRVVGPIGDVPGTSL